MTLAFVLGCVAGGFVVGVVALVILAYVLEGTAPQ